MTNMEDRQEYCTDNRSPWRWKVIRTVLKPILLICLISIWFLVQLQRTWEGQEFLLPKQGTGHSCSPKTVAAFPKGMKNKTNLPFNKYKKRFDGLGKDIECVEIIQLSILTPKYWFNFFYWLNFNASAVQNA